MKVIRDLVLAASLASLACASIGPANAAANIALTNLTGAEYDTAGVFVKGTISFDGTTNDAGGFDQVLLQLLDDGSLKFEQTFSVGVGSFGSFDWEAFYPGVVATGQEGVGLYVHDLPSGVVELRVDPFNVPHYPDPSQCQQDCGPSTAVPEPATWATMILGFGLVGLAMRRRRPASRLAGATSASA